MLFCSTSVKPSRTAVWVYLRQSPMKVPFNDLEQSPQNINTLI